MYGSYKRHERVALWKWMESRLIPGNWVICDDFNHIERVEDSVGPSPFLHGSKRHVWNRVLDKLDLLDNQLIGVQKT